MSGTYLCNIKSWIQIIFTFIFSSVPLSAKIPDMFKKATKSPKAKETNVSGLSPEEMDIIKGDSLNTKLWTECIEICKQQGRKVFFLQTLFFVLQY